MRKHFLLNGITGVCVKFSEETQTGYITLIDKNGSVVDFFVGSKEDRENAQETIRRLYSQLWTVDREEESAKKAQQ